MSGGNWENQLPRAKKKLKKWHIFGIQPYSKKYNTVFYYTVPFPSYIASWFWFIWALVSWGAGAGVQDTGTGKGETDSDGTGILGCDTITEVVGETVGAF